MKKESEEIHTKQDLNKFIDSFNNNSEKLDELFNNFHTEYLQIKLILDYFMEIYNEEHEIGEIKKALKQLFFQFYVHYNTINFIGSFKTKIYNDRLILDHNSIGAILRIMLELTLKIKFIYSEMNSNYSITKFRYFVWKYCDLKQSSKDWNLYDKKKNDITEINKLYSKIKLLKVYKTLSINEIKAIEKGNWLRFHEGFIYTKSKINQSVLNSFWYEHYSNYIHTNFNSLPNMNNIFYDKSRLDNMLLNFGMASYLGKELILLFHKLQNKALKKTDIDFNLNLKDKIQIWINESNNTNIFDKNIKTDNHTANNSD